MHLPQIGFGTWQLAEGKEAEESVSAAIAAGYKLLDTAKIYGNENSVGQAIEQSKQRDELIVTTKLWVGDMGYQSALDAFSASLSRLDLEYVDLYLVHWPGRSTKVRQDSWRALEEIHQSGKAKHIGVSNYQVEHLEEMLGYAKTKPAVNQIEFHPFIYEKQRPILEFCKQEGIALEAYSPLAQAGKLKDATLVEIGHKHNKTPAQVMLRWAIQHSATPIPRSSNVGRIKQNLEVFDFELDDDDMRKINRLSTGRSVLG